MENTDLPFILTPTRNGIYSAFAPRVTSEKSLNSQKRSLKESESLQSGDRIL